MPFVIIAQRAIRSRAHSTMEPRDTMAAIVVSGSVTDVSAICGIGETENGHPLTPMRGFKQTDARSSKGLRAGRGLTATKVKLA